MLGNKTLREIRTEISKRLKEAGIDEEQFRAQLGTVKLKKPVTVKSMLGKPDSAKGKKRRRAVSNTH